jgi:hypothetical protein
MPTIFAEQKDHLMMPLIDATLMPWGPKSHSKRGVEIHGAVASICWISNLLWEDYSHGYVQRLCLWKPFWFQKRSETMIYPLVI